MTDTTEAIGFEAPPQLIFSLLLEAAQNDPLLAQTIETARWKAAAITLKQKEMEEQAGGEEPDVPDDS